MKAYKGFNMDMTCRRLQSRQWTDDAGNKRKNAEIVADNVYFADSKRSEMVRLIYNDGFALVYVDTRTGVQYFSISSCGTCVMLDENGLPLINNDYSRHP